MGVPTFAGGLRWRSLLHTVLLTRHAGAPQHGTATPRRGPWKSFEMWESTQVSLSSVTATLSCEHLSHVTTLLHFNGFHKIVYKPPILLNYSIQQTKNYSAKLREKFPKAYFPVSEMISSWWPARHRPPHCTPSGPPPQEASHFGVGCWEAHFVVVLKYIFSQGNLSSDGHFTPYIGARDCFA